MDGFREIEEIERSFGFINGDIDAVMESLRAEIVRAGGKTSSSVIVSAIKRAFCDLSGRLDRRENILVDHYEAVGSIEEGIGNAALRV